MLSSVTDARLRERLRLGDCVICATELCMGI